jgi:hypothetical protein
MTVLDAMTGRVLEEVLSQSRVAYGVNVMSGRRYLLPNAWGGTLTAFDIETSRERPLASLFPQLARMDWSGVPDRFRQFYSLDVATHYSVNGAGDFLWSQVRNSARRSGGAASVDGGLVFLDLRERRSALVPLYAPLLENAVEPDRSRFHRWNDWSDQSVNLFGIGYVATMSPDERWLYHGTYAGDFKVIVWDNTVWPPRTVGVMGEGLSSEREMDPLSGNMIGCRSKSGAWVSADGRIVFTSDSWYFDTRTWKPMGLMRNDAGKIIRCAKMNEVHFRGKDCVYFGQRFGYGRYREPATIFPPSADKTPPTEASALTAAMSKPEARWSGGDVVVSVELHWEPATDNEGVQRYAVYRDGELIGNCLGRNPGDPVLSATDAAVFREQVGKVKENSFIARYLKPGKRYRFEIEPVDFAQNLGPRIGLDVAVPALDALAEDALVKAWAERILARAREVRKDPGKAEQSYQCMEALADWIEHKHGSRTWANAVLRRGMEYLVPDDKREQALRTRIESMLAKERP